MDNHLSFLVGQSERYANLLRDTAFATSKEGDDTGNGAAGAGAGAGAASVGTLSVGDPMSDSDDEPFVPPDSDDTDFEVRVSLCRAFIASCAHCSHEPDDRAQDDEATLEAAEATGKRLRRRGGMLTVTDEVQWLKEEAKMVWYIACDPLHVAFQVAS